MDIEEEIARAISAYRHNATVVWEEDARLAQALMPLIRRAQAEALREAAADNESGWALRTWLNNRADRIERNSEGSK